MNNHNLKIMRWFILGLTTLMYGLPVIIIGIHHYLKGHEFGAADFGFIIYGCLVWTAGIWYFIWTKNKKS